MWNVTRLITVDEASAHEGGVGVGQYEQERGSYSIRPWGFLTCRVCEGA